MFWKAILALFFIHTINAQQCKYTRDKLIGNRCYSFVSKKHHYKAARQYCHDEGFFLATVDSAIDSNFVAATAASEFGKSNGDLFYWDDNSTVSYLNFERGYPNKHDNVAERIATSRWVTLDSSKSIEFVCSYPPFVKPTTTVRPTTTTSTTKRATTQKLLTTTTRKPTTTTTRRTTCPEGFTLYPETSKCYLIIDYGKDSKYPPLPDDAPPLARESQRCEKYGATLATIHSEGLNDFFRSLIYKQYGDMRYTTIGMRNMNGNWEWIDQSAKDFVNFGEDFPKVGDSLVQMSPNGFWVSFTRTAANEGVMCSVDL
ncbi:unnamed protein product [Caenorhabditis bovis]|uniref:C-type lectin domain-containing protein n=1 Tax=Caenorhabditis bovis TaxID=2654633 RepID=A0A8S1F6R9_9PELO|nr:unnamed protein product [Caenorhabditis bovis]